jgi:predicted transcriptional regulator
MGVSFTDRELDVMAVLWRTGSATVREVQQQLEPDLAYTTVLTILRTLEAKGHVGRELHGKAHRYHPEVHRDEAGSTALGQILTKIFSGSPDALLTRLVSDQNLNESDLRRLRKLLDERLAEEEE